MRLLLQSSAAHVHYDTAFRWSHIIFFSPRMFTAVIQGADVKQVSAFPIQHVPLSLIIQTSSEYKKS